MGCRTSGGGRLVLFCLAWRRWEGETGVAGCGLPCAGGPFTYRGWSSSIRNMATRYAALGPALSGEGSRAFLGLRIADEDVGPCVLVWVPEHVTSDPELVERLRRETARATALTHPNILRVYGLTDVDEGLARVVEFADGESLRRIFDVADGLPACFAARIAVDAALGVQYAHLAGNDDGAPLVHGDLRPETLLVSYSGVTKISGYGALTVAPRELGGRRVVARRRYSAPEQILGGRYAVTPQTDVYLLGVILYEALTGEIPFQAASDFDDAVLTQPPALDSELVPPRLRSVIGMALAKRGNQRFPTVQSFREAVEEEAGELPERTELGNFLKRAFAGDEACAARRRTLDAGIKEWTARKRLPAPVSLRPSEQDELELFSVSPPYTDPEECPAGSPVEPKSLPQCPPPTPPVIVPPSTERESTASPAASPAGGGAPALPPVIRARSLDGAEDRAVRQPATPQVQKRRPVWAIIIPFVLVAVMAAFVTGKRSVPARELPAVRGMQQQPSVDGGQRVREVGPISSRGREPASPPLALATPLPAKSMLEVTTDPPLAVAVDGRAFGRAPVKIQVSAGAHRVALSDPARGIRLTRNVRIHSGANHLELTVGKGSVSVSAPTGCEVRIDGRFIGKVPLEGPLELFEGGHHIKVSLGDAQWQRAFSLAAGEQVSVDVRFEPR